MEMSVIISFLTALIFLIVFLSMFFVIPWFFGAPYEGTSQNIVKRIVRESKIKKGQKAVDIGSGDGRFVIEFAKRGIETHGFEINPLLVLISKYKIRKAKLQDKAFIHWKSFWNTNLGNYNVIVLFQFKTIMNKLEKKLNKELKPKSKIISYYWKFPKLKLKRKIGKIYFYGK